ncbi:MAG TPA: patatin-like phospholipase family protein [Gemmataceae bacterium]|nr:patatin-like phospholipase family protein [Gemmataceae bacterium]
MSDLKTATVQPSIRAPASKTAGFLDQTWAWYARHFWTGFCYYLPLPLTLLFLVALVCWRLGESFGVNELVWHDDGRMQAAVGGSLALIWVEVLFIGYLLWLNDQRGEAELTFYGYAWRITACFLATVGLLAFIRFAVAQLANILDGGGKVPGLPAAEGIGHWLYLPGGAAVTALLAAGILRALSGRPQDKRTLPADKEPESKQADVSTKQDRSGSRPRESVFAFALCSLALWGAAAAFTWQDLDRISGWIRVAVLAIVFLLNVAAAGSGSVAGYAWIVLTNAGLAYAGVAWTLSRHNWPFALVALGIALVVVPALLYFCLPQATADFVARAQQFFRGPVAPGPEEVHNRKLGLWATVAGVLVFVVVCAVPALASPVPVACFMLFVALVLYGMFKLVIRHALPVALGVLLFLAILAGVQPYKFRFSPGLGYSEEGVRDVPAAVKEDGQRQQAFDTALRAYLTARTKHGDLVDQQQQLQSDPAQRDELSKVRQALTQAKAALAQQTLALQEQWSRLEQNQVVPGRLLRSDVLAVLRPQQQAGQPSAAAAGPLWISDIDFLRATPKRPVVLIAASGGGLRAAAWTFTVLQELEKELASTAVPDFPSHVRVLTGASGGMLGAAYYTAALEPPEQRLHGRARIDQLQQQFDKLTLDCLTPVMRQYAFGDLPSLFSPWSSRYDRGHALEAAWSRNLDGALDQTFQDLRAGEKAGWRPALAFTPMMIEDGRRLIISNLDLRYALSNDGNLLTGEAAVEPLLHPSENYSLDAWELFRLFPEARGAFKLSTAVRMSASFPFFSPAVSLPTMPRRRVVDAGYYDNYGVTLSAAWLFSGVHWSWIEQHASKVVLIQIRDGSSDEQRTLRRVDPDSSTGASRALEEFLSPLEGLNNGRQGSSSFRNDGQLELLSQFLRTKLNPDFDPALAPPHVKRFFTVVTFEFPYQAALSWHLTDDERKQLQEAIHKAPGFQKKIKQLIAWWKAEEDKNN